MSDIIKGRIKALRSAMAEAGITAWYITTADFHNSEYVSDYFKVREFFSGFTGSNGDLLVTEDSAGLWTDGRYFVQAEKELEGSGITLFKMGEENVPTVLKYIENDLGEGDTLGFDGKTVTAAFGKKLKKIAEKQNFSIRYKKDITEGIFDRPAFPVSPAEVLNEELTGESVKSKLERVREKIGEEGADALFLNKLDDIMYLFNIRGNDVECNPVIMSYAYISMDRSVLFIQNGAVNPRLESHLRESGTEIRDYLTVDLFLKELEFGTKVMADPEQMNYRFYKMLKKQTGGVINGKNPTALMKAVKNKTEIENMRKIYLKDSLALTRFILKISKSADSEYTEMDAADLLLSLRKEIPEFRDLSFPTISAYGENAAMMHYEPGHDHEVPVQKKGFLLVDSGGQYNGGTTDVTRTIVMGELTEEEKHDYTLTACSMLRLMNAKWLSGCTGRNLDILARERMWNEGMDYKCGTGHGVGYILNVHEGPHNIRWKATENEAELKPGMAVTDEPGVYKAGKYGIRIENVLLVKEDEKTTDGQFLSFENLTFAPIDDKGIDRSIMSEKEIEMYRRYQGEVYESLEGYLSDEEKRELREYCGQTSLSS